MLCRTAFHRTWHNDSSVQASTLFCAHSARSYSTYSVCTLFKTLLKNAPITHLPPHTHIHTVCVLHPSENYKFPRVCNTHGYNSVSVILFLCCLADRCLFKTPPTQYSRRQTQTGLERELFRFQLFVCRHIGFVSIGEGGGVRLRFHRFFDARLEFNVFCNDGNAAGTLSVRRFPACLF